MAYTLIDIEVPEFHWDLENNTAMATRKCRMTPWSAMDEFITDYAGSTTSFGQLLIQIQPNKYPGKDHLWLMEIRAKPFFECVGDPDANDLPEDPAGAEVSLIYRTPKHESRDGHPDIIPPDTFLTFDRNMSLEFAYTKAEGLYWKAGQAGGIPYMSGGYEGVAEAGHPLDRDTHVSACISVGDLSITWHRVKQPPWAAIYALQGTVNNDTFFGFDAEQVLFVGVSDQRQFQTDGTDLWRLTYRFNIRIPKFQSAGQVNIGETYTGFDYIKNLPQDIVVGGWNHYPRPGAVGAMDADTEDDIANDSPFWQKVYRRQGTEDRPQTDKDLLYIPTDFRKLFQPDQDSEQGNP